MSPGPEFLLGFADFVILALVVLLMLHMFRRRKFSPLAPVSGRSIVLAGILLIALIQVGEWFLPTAVDVVGTAPQLLVPDWTFWVSSRTAILMIVAGLFIATEQRRRAEQAALASSAKIKAATDIAVQSEQSIRSLFETASNSLSCWKIDPPMPITLPTDAQVECAKGAILTECNDAFARDVGYEMAADVIGMPMSELDSVKDAEAHRKFMMTLISGDYRVTDYDLNFKSSAGEDRALRLSVTGIVKGGRLLRFWAAATNMLAARKTQTALYRRRIFQEMLAGVSSRLVKSRRRDADATMLSCMQEVCEFIGGNRMTVSWVDIDRLSGEVVYTWHEGDGQMINEIDIERFPFLAEKLLQGVALRVPSLDDLPPEAATDVKNLRAVGMKSFLFFPLTVSDNIVGLLTMGNDVSHRDWTEQDLLDLRVFGELFANFVMRLRQRRALDDALESLQQATDRLEAENVYLRSEIKLDHDFDEIIGMSDELRRSLQMVEQVADTMTPVLILGETGTGKELVARAVHEHSSRRHRPLVKVNCAALPASLIESELFGYEKGAFTSADSSKRGRFDLAHGSTLFLDEIGEIPIELQAKLLRVLQDGEFERLGGDKTIKVDVRLIAATNRDLWDACEAGDFRTDLYYRINTFPIELPPLRDRGDDIRLLAEHFIRQHAPRLGRQVTAMSARMMRQLEGYEWPGNVRELESVIQRALISTSGPVLELGQALGERKGSEISVLSHTIVPNLQSVERDHILSVLAKTNWKISGDNGAAATLEIPPSTLRSKMKKLGIERPA